METLKSFFYQTFEAAGLILPKQYFTRWVLPAAAGMLLAYGSPFTQALFRNSAAQPLPVAALAFCCACWCSLGKQSFTTSALGVLAGCAAGGTYAGCIAAALMFACAGGLHLLRRDLGVRAINKYESLFAACLGSLPLGAALRLWKASLGGALEHLLICSLAVSLAAFLSIGLTAVCSENKRLSAISGDIKLLSLAMLAGLITAAFSYSRVFGIGLGNAAAALFCLVAAKNGGLSAIACAAVISASRVFALGADMLFIAVLCVCTLCAVLLMPLGKWGILAGFCAPSIALFYFMNGAGSISPAELILGGAVYLLADIELAIGEKGALRSESEKWLEQELIKRNRRLKMLSDVLLEMACLFGGAERGTGGFVNAQLSGVAKSLARLAAPTCERSTRYQIGIGAAGSPGRGSVQTGDTACIREMDGLSLAAISDGMGMGEAARRESEQTVNMVADLVSCGFDIQEAADLVNRLLALREGGEMYATLDAMLFDRSGGSVIAAKHGAPASYIFRHGKLNALCAEALPVGIVEEAKTAVFNVRIKHGDVIIMMSDGVSDALGDALDATLKRTAAVSDPNAAAKELIESARRMGGADDMTAIVAMVG